LLAISGALFISKNKKWLLAQLVVGLIFWAAYSFWPWRFIIDYERAVYFTSILVTLAAGFGLEYIFSVIPGLKRNPERREQKSLFPTWIPRALAGMTLVVIFLVTPFYTQRESWKKLVLVDEKTTSASYPKAPANNYLTNDDLRIFENIKGKKFLSIPWKGTVIGVATGNFPAITKEGTISVGQEGWANNFQNSDCKIKKEISKQMNLDYVYLSSFDCEGFKKIDQSNEGFVLYEVNL
jgi:hypothetical protein